MGEKFAFLKKKEFWLRCVIVIVFVALLATAIVFANRTEDDETFTTSAAGVIYVRGKVIAVESESIQVDESRENVKSGSQELVVEVREGLYKGDQMRVTNYISALFDTSCKVGSRVVVQIITTDEGSVTTDIYSMDRSFALYGMLLFFMALVCIIGGKKGIKALVSLVFSLICIVFLLLPLVLKGYPPLLLTIAIVIVSTVVTFIVLDGINKKTITAMIGSISGVAVAAGLAAIIGKLVRIDGYSLGEAEELILMSSDSTLFIRNLFTAGILISAMGAVMDVAMSISSSSNELYDLNPKISQKQLFRSGMNIGRDAMGTMVNTLILAFAGSSLALLLVILSSNIPFRQLISTNFMGMELIQGIAGSVGIVMTVPIVSWISSMILTRKKSE